MHAAGWQVRPAGPAAGLPVPYRPRLQLRPHHQQQQQERQPEPAQSPPCWPSPGQHVTGCYSAGHSPVATNMKDNTDNNMTLCAYYTLPTRMVN